MTGYPRCNMSDAPVIESLPSGTVACPPCLGSGMKPGVTRTKCPMCEGEGILPDTRKHLPKCRFCDGRGLEPGINFTLCQHCDGWGQREWKATVVDPLAPQTVG